MKRIIISLLLLFGLLPFIQSQTVDSIKVEQAGDLIKIHYKILNSNPNQVFRVTVLCSINGGLQSVIKSLSGDFGDNVVGGRSEYMVLWDVLKDVDEVKSVDFSVKAELIRDNTNLNLKEAKKDKVHKKNFNIMASAQLPGPGFGIRTGYMGNFGFSVQYIVGKAVLIPNSGYTSRPNLKHITLDLTKRIINKESFQMHMMIGMGVGQAIIKEVYSGYTDYKIKYEPIGELGFACCLRKSTFALTYSHIFFALGEDTQTESALSKLNFLALSFGLRF
jgi:hypothetical protein